MTKQKHRNKVCISNIHTFYILPQGLLRNRQMEILNVSDLCKTYPSFTLDHVSFSLEKGYIMGFIGRNGAGKTTTLKSMLRFVHPDSGTVTINGFNVEKDEFAVKNCIGFVSGLDGFYSSKRIKQVTDVTKRFFFSEEDKERVFELARKHNKKIKIYDAWEYKQNLKKFKKEMKISNRISRKNKKK